MARSWMIRNILIEMHKGEVTDLDGKVDAIVVPANTKLHMNSGAAATVRLRGGDDIEWDATRQGPANYGDVIVTTPGELQVKSVLHAVINDERSRTDGDKIENGLLNTLKVARDMDLKSIAMPAFGLGVGGLPFDQVAHIMLSTIRNFIETLKSKPKLEHIIITVHSSEAMQAFEDFYMG